ncbi:hypothetical protein TNCV_1204971 [Trichonephila clavipes]|nr:hypothetical protein TNCV_1204971 [Trichonephila clavipes]
MAQHRPRKSTLVEYTADDEDTIVYDVEEDTFKSNPDFVVKNGKTYFRGSDEAHFWLNGYVNKQNWRIWSKANPQVYVETPLHPEKLTVCCALWAGGILLQKR